MFSGVLHGGEGHFGIAGLILSPSLPGRSRNHRRNLRFVLKYVAKSGLVHTVSWIMAALAPPTIRRPMVLMRAIRPFATSPLWSSCLPTMPLTRSSQSWPVVGSQEEGLSSDGQLGLAVGKGAPSMWLCGVDQGAPLIWVGAFGGEGSPPIQGEVIDEGCPSTGGNLVVGEGAPSTLVGAFGGERSPPVHDEVIDEGRPSTRDSVVFGEGTPSNREDVLGSDGGRVAQLRDLEGSPVGDGAGGAAVGHRETSLSAEEEVMASVSDVFVLNSGEAGDVATPVGSGCAIHVVGAVWVVYVTQLSEKSDAVDKSSMG